MISHISFIISSICDKEKPNFMYTNNLNHTVYLASLITNVILFKVVEIPKIQISGKNTSTISRIEMILSVMSYVRKSIIFNEKSNLKLTKNNYFRELQL